MTDYVFGYGSLLSPISIGQTINRDVSCTELLPAWLKGYKKDWSAYSQHQTYLNVIEKKLHKTLGVILKIKDDTEWMFLDLRESLYEKIDITDKIVAFDNNFKLGEKDRVFTYSIKEPVAPKHPQIFWDYYEFCYTSAYIYGEAYFKAWKKDLSELIFT